MRTGMRALLALAAAAWLAGASTPEVTDRVGKVVQTIGAADLKSIAYSGSGFAYAFGQSYAPGGPYPKFYARYSRAIDFEKKLSREETIRTQFEDPPRGGGNQPLYREARGVLLTGENSAWGGGAVELSTKASPVA